MNSGVVVKPVMYKVSVRRRYRLVADIGETARAFSSPPRLQCLFVLMMQLPSR